MLDFFSFMKTKARIIGTGVYLPKKVLTNADLEKIVETSDEWIVSRTGMKERRIAADDEFSSTMGAEAAKEAIENAGLSVEDIDLIIVATSTPDYFFPSTAALIQKQINARNIPSFDLQAACTGFLYGLEMAKAHIEAGLSKNVLLIATEKLSSMVNYKDRRTCVLFGDGAAAAVISNQGAGLFINEVCLGADGGEADLLKIPGGGSRQPTTQQTLDEDKHFIEMQGKEVFKHAVRRMESATKECLAKAGLEEKDLSYLIPHQANERIIDAMAKRFEIEKEKVMKTVHKYGNTSASGVAIALHEMLGEKDVQNKEHILLVAFGAGFTWGAALLTKDDHE